METKNAGNKVVVVVSAMGKTTDELVDLALAINPNPPSREMDVLLATGEQVSISLLAMAIQTIGHDVVSLTGAQCGIQTSDVHKRARISGIDLPMKRLSLWPASREWMKTAISRLWAEAVLIPVRWPLQRL